MFGACWDDYDVAGFDVLSRYSVSICISFHLYHLSSIVAKGIEERKSHLFLASHNSFSLSRRKDQDLIHKMHFVADISTDRDLHGDQLRIQSCVDDLAELAKGAYFGGQAVKVDQFVLWGLSGHFRVFGVEGSGGEEGAFGEGWEDGSCGDEA